jgi:heptosyltransferase II
MRYNNKKKILISGFLGLGDMVMFSPCFRILRAGFPDSEIVLVTHWEPVNSLFKESPYIDKIILFDLPKANFFEKLKFLKSLRKMCFDISILPFPSYRRELNIISAVVGAADRYCFNFHKGKWTEFTFLNNHQIQVDRSLHSVENNLKLMHTIGLETRGKQEKYDIPVQHSSSFVDNFLLNMNISTSDFKVGIHPGSDMRTKDKRLDISKFAEISDFVAGNYKARVLVFLGRHEEDLKREFLSSARYPHTIVENLELDKVAQLISCCQIFISNDSGLMHVASAMGAPTVTIFGPTNHNSVSPWGVPYEIVRLGLKCSPCFFGTERRPLNKPLIECRIDEKFACMKRIESRDVMEKVKKMISLLYPEKESIIDWRRDSLKPP